MKQSFWKIAHASTSREYQEAMQEIRQLRPSAATDLEEKAPPHDKWCRAFFKTDSMIELVDNNLCEAFNGSLLTARKLSIISLFEAIRKRVMERIAMKLKECNKWKGNLGKRIWRVIEKNSKKANYCHVAFNGVAGYEVIQEESRYTVNLAEKICSCRRYSLYGIPCAHAICAIRDKRGKVEEYVSSWFSKNVYIALYSNVLEPMPGRSDWPKSASSEEPVKPPEFRTLVGRPKTSRRKLHDEPKKGTAHHLSRKGMIMTCKLCHQEGHNKRGCPKKDNTGSVNHMSSNIASHTSASNSPSSATSRENTRNANGRTMNAEDNTANVHQASSSSTGQKVDACASGSIVFTGPSVSITANFTVSSSATSSASMPANASASASFHAPVNVPIPRPGHVPSFAPASSQNPNPKPTFRTRHRNILKPLPKILSMSKSTESCWVDEAGNYHGLNRGRSSPSSTAKFSKPRLSTENPISFNQSASGNGKEKQAPQVHVRRSPRNQKRKATDDVVPTQESQNASSAASKGKKKMTY